jgi:hypothetical protein
MVESQRGKGDDDGITDQLGQGPGGFIRVLVSKKC